MIPKKTVRASKITGDKNLNQLVLARILCKVAKDMFPFYQAIAFNRVYAKRWSHAVVNVDVPAMQRLFRLASPGANNPLPGTDGRGYIINFEFKGPINLYGSGTENTSVTAKFIFQTKVHRAIAKAILPLYKELAVNSAFTRALALAIQRGDSKAVTFIVRSVVKTPQLRSVSIEEFGLALTFKYPFSNYTYEHFLFHEEFE